MNEIHEFQRIPSAAPHPQGIAYDGGSFWISSCSTGALFRVEPSMWTLQSQFVAPGEPFGISPLGNRICVVVGFGNDADDRYIYLVDPEEGFDHRGVPCPGLSGAYVAWDGQHLFLGQAHNKKILSVNSDGDVLGEISLERRPVGMAAVDDLIYLITADDDWTNHELAELNVAVEQPRAITLASIPFRARGLAFDGSHFWTTHRDTSELIAFTH